MSQDLAQCCPEHPDTVMTVNASWAFPSSDGRRHLLLDVAFEGLPPDDSWEVHTLALQCPHCAAIVEVPVR